MDNTEYDLPNGWTCICCENEYPEDTTGQEVASYNEGPMCLSCTRLYENFYKSPDEIDQE